jgi:DNA-binding HxlR family transcriptional regulator
MSDDLRDRTLLSEDAVELLSDKWRITLLHLFTPGPQRAKALQQAVTKISPKVLTQTQHGKSCV